MLFRSGEIAEYVLEANGLRVFFVPRPHSGVVTSSIMYKVGSRDEICGETGLAHMLEHMLMTWLKYRLQSKRLIARTTYGCSSYLRIEPVSIYVYLKNEKSCEFSILA